MRTDRARYLLLRVARGLALGMVVLGYIFIFPAAMTAADGGDNVLALLFPGVLIPVGSMGLVMLRRRWGSVLAAGFVPSRVMYVFSFVLLGLGVAWCLSGAVNIFAGFLLMAHSKSYYFLASATVFLYLIPGLVMFLAGLRTLRRHRPAWRS